MRFRILHWRRRFFRYWTSNQWASSWRARATIEPIVDLLLLEQSIQELGWENQKNCRFQYRPAILANLQSREATNAHFRRLWSDDFPKWHRTKVGMSRESSRWSSSRWNDQGASKWLYEYQLAEHNPRVDWWRVRPRECCPLRRRPIPESKEDGQNLNVGRLWPLENWNQEFGWFHAWWYAEYCWRQNQVQFARESIGQDYFKPTLRLLRCSIWASVIFVQFLDLLLPLTYTHIWF